MDNFLLILFILPVLAFNQATVLQDVKACPYNISDYQPYVFDCSNMAAMQYDWLTEKGHIVYLYIGENRTLNWTHAWLLVDGYWIEPTTKDFAWWMYRKEIIPDRYDSIDQWKSWSLRWRYSPEFSYPNWNEVINIRR